MRLAWSLSQSAPLVSLAKRGLPNVQSAECWLSLLHTGDQISHLWWRLLHGQMPTVHMPKVAIVLIGTNDLFAEADCLANNETQLENAVNGIFRRCVRCIRSAWQDMLPMLRALTCAEAYAGCTSQGLAQSDPCQQ